MKIRCPNGHGPLSFSATVCPVCGQKLSPIALLSFYMRKFSSALKHSWHSLWGGKDRVFTMICTRCKNPIPINQTQCPSCGLQVHLAFLFSESPRAKKFTNLLHRIYARRKLIVFSYFVASLCLLWFVLATAEEKFAGQTGPWILAAVSTVFFISISFIILPWFIKPGTFRLLATLPAFAKLSIFLNYITAIFLIMIASDIWKTRAWLLLTVFAALILAIRLFAEYLQPTWNLLGQFFDPPPSDPRQRRDGYRGRQADYQSRKWG